MLVTLDRQPEAPQRECTIPTQSPTIHVPMMAYTFTRCVTRVVISLGLGGRGLLAKKSISTSCQSKIMEEEGGNRNLFRAWYKKAGSFTITFFFSRMV